jgi:hypothetical protein
VLKRSFSVLWQATRSASRATTLPADGLFARFTERVARAKLLKLRFSTPDHENYQRAEITQQITDNEEA